MYFKAVVATTSDSSTESGSRPLEANNSGVIGRSLRSCSSRRPNTSRDSTVCGTKSGSICRMRYWPAFFVRRISKASGSNSGAITRSETSDFKIAASSGPTDSLTAAASPNELIRSAPRALTYADAAESR